MRSLPSFLFAVMMGAGVATLSLPLSAEPLPRHRMDERDLARLDENAPGALDLFKQAEARLEQGELVAAEQLFAQARSQAPGSGLLARRHCQALTELGRKEQALAACKQAVIHGRTPMDERAAVGALMVGDKPPTPTEVAEALRLVRSIQRLSDQPFGDAALCEIAYRIGDSGMFRHCLENLKRLAPDHHETRRWAAAVPPPPAWPYWMGWSLVALVGAATACHAFLTRRRSRSTVPHAARAVVLGLLGLLYAHPASAQPAPAPSIEKFPADKPPADSKDLHWQLSSDFPINPGDPEASVPDGPTRNKNALQFGYYLQDLASEGAYAEKRNEPEKAVKYWRALAKAVPDVAVGFRKACRAYEALKDRDKALEFCAQAVNREGTNLDDYSHYGALLLAKPTPLDAVELADIDATIHHLRQTKDAQPDAGVLAEQLACEVGVRLDDVKRLERCTRVLAKVAKDDQKTQFYQWTLAILNKNYPEARRLLGVLKKGGMKPEALAVLETTTQGGDWWRKPFRDWRYGMGACLVLLLVAAGLGFKRRAPRGQPAPPAPAPTA